MWKLTTFGSTMTKPTRIWKVVLATWSSASHIPIFSAWTTNTQKRFQWLIILLRRNWPQWGESLILAQDAGLATLKLLEWIKTIQNQQKRRFPQRRLMLSTSGCVNSHIMQDWNSGQSDKSRCSWSCISLTRELSKCMKCSQQTQRTPFPK